MIRYGLTAFAVRRISLHPLRWLLLGFALTLVTFLVATTVLLHGAIEATATAVIESGPSLVVSRVDAGGWSSIDTRHARAIQSIPGVHAVTPRVWGVLPGPPQLTIMADPELAGSNEARVGTAVRPAARGELLVLRGLDGAPRELRVRDLFTDRSDIVTHDVVLTAPEVARSLLLLEPGQATDLAVDSARDQENDALVDEIAAVVDVPVRVVTRAQMLGAYQVRGGRRATVSFALLLPAILGLVLLLSMTASGGVMGREDIGRLKLIGWSSGEVALLHALEVGMVGSVGVALGLVSAYAGLFVFGGATVASSVLGWQSAPDLVFSTEGAATSLVLIASSLLLPCLAASLLPAFRLARTDPSELLEAP